MHVGYIAPPLGLIRDEALGDRLFTKGHEGIHASLR